MIFLSFGSTIPDAGIYKIGAQLLHIQKGEQGVVLPSLESCSATKTFCPVSESNNSTPPSLSPQGANEMKSI